MNVDRIEAAASRSPKTWNRRLFPNLFFASSMIISPYMWLSSNLRNSINGGRHLRENRLHQSRRRAGSRNLDPPTEASEESNPEAHTERNTGAVNIQPGIWIPTGPHYDWRAVDNPWIVCGNVNDFRICR